MCRSFLHFKVSGLSQFCTTVCGVRHSLCFKPSNFEFVLHPKEKSATCLSLWEPARIQTPTQTTAWEKIGAADSKWANSFSHCMSLVKGWSPQASVTSGCVPSTPSARLSCCSQGLETVAWSAKPPTLSPLLFHIQDWQTFHHHYVSFIWSLPKGY